MFSESETNYLKSQRLARIATASTELQPDVAVVGFDFDGKYFYVGGYELPRSLKYKNIQRNPKVSFVVDDQPSVSPWVVRGVKVRGNSDLVTHEGYVGAGTYIRIEPTSKYSWGIDDEAA